MRVFYGRGVYGVLCAEIGQGEREDGRFESFLVFSRETLDVTDENGCVARVWWAPVPRLAFKCVCMERAAG